MLLELAESPDVFSTRRSLTSIAVGARADMASTHSTQALKDPADDHWSPKTHDDCLEGVCGECKGRRYQSCECLECRHEHEKRCDHCDGTGKCEYDGNIARQRRIDAKAAWQDFKNETTHPISRTGFIEAFTQMFGVVPDDGLVLDWVKRTNDLASAAGERLID